MTALGVLRRRLQPAAVVLLTVVWVLLWGSLTWGNVVFGVVLAVVALLVFPLPTLGLGLRVRPIPAVVLVARFVVDLVVSSAQVAYQAVAPWWHPQEKLLRVRLRTDDDFFATVTAQMIGLVPGTVVVEFDADRRELLLHVFHAPTQSDLDAVCRSVHAQEDRVLAALAADGRRGGNRDHLEPRERPERQEPWGRDEGPRRSDGPVPEGRS